MNSDKFDDVCKLLGDELVPDDLKCFKCRKMLINACHGPCECQLCRVCVDGLVESGCRVCPGNTELCKASNLSNFCADYRTQRRVTQLVVKCPEEMCSFECELINMNEHLRVCPNKSVKCVFYGLGCDQSNVIAANMNEHLQLASYSHMELLMGVIDNMRNEIDRLKESDERNKNEIDRLKGDSAIKAERIESLEEEIRLMKVEKMDNLEREIGKTVAKMNEGLSEMRQGWRDVLDSNEAVLDSNEAVLKATNGKYQKDMETRMSATEKWMDKLINGAFVWPIDNVAERRQNGEFIRSEYFYGKMEPYKMRLEMCVNGWVSVRGTGLSIYLLIYSDVKDGDLNWSLPADVSIRIVNKANPNVCKTITKRYTIKKPNDNSRYYLNNDGDFDFLYADLCDASLLIGDCFIIECRCDVRLNK